MYRIGPQYAIHEKVDEAFTLFAGNHSRATVGGKLLTEPSPYGPHQMYEHHVFITTKVNSSQINCVETESMSFTYAITRFIGCLISWNHRTAKRRNTLLPNL